MFPAKYVSNLRGKTTERLPFCVYEKPLGFRCFGSRGAHSYFVVFLEEDLGFFVSFFEGFVSDFLASVGAAFELGCCD